MKQTALNANHVRRKVKMAEFQGWSLPVQFTDLEDEHHAVRAAAGLFDAGFLGRLELSGPGAIALLQSLFTRKVDDLADGTVLYGLFCDDEGFIIDNALIMKKPSGKNGPRFLITTNPGAASAVQAWISGKKGSDAVLSDRTAEIAQLALQGPAADQVLEKLAGTHLKKLKEKKARELTLAGAQVLVSRTGYTGERGYELFVPAVSVEALWEAILEAGKNLGVLPCGMMTREILRMEAGFAQQGNEIDKTRTPVETALLAVVDLSKDQFVGKAAIEKRKAAGAEEALVGFELLDKGIPKLGGTIFSENREIGTVTSGSHSYHRRRDIGLGYVKKRYDQPGQEVEIEVKDREVAAKIVHLPFYHRK
ncbi:MAG: glycine cleavage system aminomethyltransferase GcvT [Nitrospiraceae bacterium]|nr:glycine cleavage system aminomethyltransferase GcvT [Nitrospiraceae bacterium]